MMLWRMLAAMLTRMRALYWHVVYLGLRSRYEVDPTFRFNGAGVQLYGDGRIVLGPGSYIGEYSSIQAARDHQVRIGRVCRISHNVRVYTETADADTDFRASKAQPESARADVSIGDGAWIGANVFIGPGISIGANAVVGANSVVTHNIPEGEIWGGVPARRIRSKRPSQLA